MLPNLAPLEGTKGNPGITEFIHGLEGGRENGSELGYVRRLQSE